MKLLAIHNRMSNTNIKHSLTSLKHHNLPNLVTSNPQNPYKWLTTNYLSFHNWFSIFFLQFVTYNTIPTLNHQRINQNNPF
jgi:hypothetical protein